MPQLLPAPTVSCQSCARASPASPVLISSRQFATFFAGFVRSFSFFLFFFGGEFRLFALLVQTKQISLTLGCLACKCHFSVQITQFITFHLTRRVESRVKQSKSPNESRSLPLFPSLPLVPHPDSAPFRTANVFPIPTPWPNWQSEFLMGFCDESSHVSHVASPTVIEVNFIARGKQFNFLQSIGKT